MTIRKLTAEDFNTSRTLLRELLRHHAQARPDCFAPEQAAEGAPFEELVSGERRISLLAEEEGTAAGICLVTLRDRSNMVRMPIAWMDDLYVREEFRRRGVAKALFAAAEREARGRGALRLDLMVWAFNESALAFYRSLGMDVQRYVMEKPL